MCASSCGAQQDPLAGPPLQLGGEGTPGARPRPDPRLVIAPEECLPPLSWGPPDPLPPEVVERALHPPRITIGLDDSHLIVSAVPLSTRAANELRLTGEPRSWMLLAFGVRALF
jgi:hypothetical protein